MSDPYDPHKPEIFCSDDNPFGELNPEGGFKIGDYVALAYSDHEEYIFDNPEGVITAIDEENERVTVFVPATIAMNRVFLQARPKPGQTIAPDGEIILKLEDGEK